MEFLRLLIYFLNKIQKFCKDWDEIKVFFPNISPSHWKLKEHHEQRYKGEKDELRREQHGSLFDLGRIFKSVR